MWKCWYCAIPNVLLQFCCARASAAFTSDMDVKLIADVNAEQRIRKSVNFDAIFFMLDTSNNII
jgi:hypothetical protein